MSSNHNIIKKACSVNQYAYLSEIDLFYQIQLNSTSVQSSIRSILDSLNIVIQYYYSFD